MQLAIETTGRNGSIAVLSAETILRQSNLDASQRSAATLAPEIDHTLRWCSENDYTLGFITVADGPGSFTGLRIGVTTAKTLSYALRLPLVAVDSLAAIAAASFHSDPTVDVLRVAINAYRGQVFHGSFDRAELLPSVDSLPRSDADGNPWTSHPACVQIAEADAWQRVLQEGPKTRLAGEAKPFGELADNLVPRSCDAVGVGLMGFRAAICSEWVDPLGLVPRYLKPSAAEENAAATR